MFGIEIVLILLFVRVILPVGLLLWIGNSVRWHEANYWLRPAAR